MIINGFKDPFKIKDKPVIKSKKIITQQSLTFQKQFKKNRGDKFESEKQLLHFTLSGHNSHFYSAMPTV